MDGLYKVLVDGRGPYSGVAWPLPTDDGPGDWVEAHDPGPLVMCRNGVHLTDWTGVWSGWAQAGMTIYEVEADGERIGDITTDDRKIAVRRARLTRRVPDAELPAWWRAAMAFVASIPATPWFAPAGDPDPAWRMFDIRARDATTAYDAATAAAYATTAYDAHDAAYDAALLARCLIVADHIDPEYLAHARARWDVWQRGYGLAGVVDDVFYVYRQP